MSQRIDSFLFCFHVEYELSVIQRNIIRQPFHAGAFGTLVVSSSFCVTWLGQLLPHTDKNHRYTFKVQSNYLLPYAQRRQAGTNKFLDKGSRQGRAGGLWASLVP